MQHALVKGSFPLQINSVCAIKRSVWCVSEDSSLYIPSVRLTKSPTCFRGVEKLIGERAFLSLSCTLSGESEHEAKLPSASQPAFC